MEYKAVLFDLGGVVLGSPLHAIARYERKRGVPAGFVNRVVLSSGSRGAWSCLERGDLSLQEFHTAFDAECSAAGQAIDARALMERVQMASEPRPLMLEAIRRIRARGLSTGAITNNWVSEGEGTRELRPNFDAFVESCVTGVRKPDPRIYRIACEGLGIDPAQAVFLDDIGANLKPARALGMTTIKVDDPVIALRELGSALELELLA